MPAAPVREWLNFSEPESLGQTLSVAWYELERRREDAALEQKREDARKAKADAEKAAAEAQAMLVRWACHTIPIPHCIRRGVNSALYRTKKALKFVHKGRHKTMLSSCVTPCRLHSTKQWMRKGSVRTCAHAWA